MTQHETYVRSLLKLAIWSVYRDEANYLAGRPRELFADRVGQDLFGARIAQELLDRDLIEPWGTTRLGAPAYRPTNAALWLFPWYVARLWVRARFGAALSKLTAPKIAHPRFHASTKPAWDCHRHQTPPIKLAYPRMPSGSDITPGPFTPEKGKYGATIIIGNPERPDDWVERKFRDRA